MYKVNKCLYINPEKISALYRKSCNSEWRLVMNGASEKDEFPLTDRETENLIKFLDIYDAIKRK